MNIVFMGTPDFAVPCLEKLIALNHTVQAVMTQADKPKGRGHKLMPTPVKECAQKYGLTVFQPDTLRNNDEIYNILCDLHPDFIVVVAYGKILPERILNIPNIACINVHASLLPKYRGAGPIQWSVLDGQKKTGVTTILMEKGIDTGDMFLKEETEIKPYETAGELTERLSYMGASVLEKTLKDYDKITPEKQDDSLSSYAPMLSKDMAKIDFSKTAHEICHLICGMNPWPVAYSYYQGEVVKIYEAIIYEGEVDENAKPGTILSYIKKEGLIVKTKNGAIVIRTVQFKNSKKLSIDAYMSGHNIVIGEILGGE
jgi:methionyl-tRNA formyltransferase